MKFVAAMSLLAVDYFHAEEDNEQDGAVGLRQSGCGDERLGSSAVRRKTTFM